MQDARDDLGRSELQEIMEFAGHLATRSRSIVLSDDLRVSDIHNKSPGGDPVTNIDMLIEEEWIKSIRQRYPEHNIVGEESGSVSHDNDVTWVLDPIDGTDDLIRNSPLFGSIIAVLFKGDPIVAVVDHPRLNLCCQAMYGSGLLVNGIEIGPSQCLEQKIGEAIVVPAYDDWKKLENCDELVTAIGRAIPNQRTFRNVYGHTMVAMGKFSAGLEVDVALWDLAATRLLVEQANGKFVIFRDTGGCYSKRRLGAVFGRADIVDRIELILNGRA